MIRKCHEQNTDVELALLNYRNTPIQELDASPAQLLMSRRLRQRIPTAMKSLTPYTQSSKMKQIKNRQQTQK